MLVDILILLYFSFLPFNLILSLFIIFFEHKPPSSTWCWLLVVILLSPIGFFLYLILGYDGKKYSIFKNKALNDEKFYTDFYSNNLSSIKSQFEFFSNENLLRSCDNFSSVAFINLFSANSPLTTANKIDVFFNGKDKFSKLFKDITEAKAIIFLEYYILRDDALGKALLSLLIKKCQDGIQVYILYDGMGNWKNQKSFFKPLIDVGGRVAVFLPPKFIRLNYRNHRKICVIDNKIGYLGGFNIGTEYIGNSPKFGAWRDCHIRLTGNAVMDLSLRFITDFNFFSDYKISLNQINNQINNSDEKDFNNLFKIPLQILSSGHDCEDDNILNSIFKLINSAQKSILIQTPYFMPDDSIMQALKTALLSGIEVKIIIPSKPDHPFVYWASLSYLGELLKNGAKCYGYINGFLHSKIIIVDNFVTSIGTANLDIRSLKLNFEVNAFIYDKVISNLFTTQFDKDVLSSKEISLSDYNKRPLSTKIKESLCRLISPLL